MTTRVKAIAIVGGIAGLLLYRRGGQFSPTAGVLERLRRGWNGVVDDAGAPSLAIGAPSSTPLTPAQAASNAQALEGDLL